MSSGPSPPCPSKRRSCEPCYSPAARGACSAGCFRLHPCPNRVQEAEATTPYGVAAISRWLSAATPPVKCNEHGPHPGRGASEFAPAALGSWHLRFMVWKVTYGRLRQVPVGRQAGGDYRRQPWTGQGNGSGTGRGRRGLDLG